MVTVTRSTPCQKAHGVLIDEHADHTQPSINDLRLFIAYKNRPLPCTATITICACWLNSFLTAFSDDAAGAWQPVWSPRAFMLVRSIAVAGLPIQTIPLQHGPAGPIAARFRFGRLAFCTDVKSLLPSAWPLLRMIFRYTGAGRLAGRTARIDALVRSRSARSGA